MHLTRLIFLSENDPLLQKTTKIFSFSWETDLCILRASKMSAVIAATVHAIKRGRPWPFDAGSVTLEPTKCIGDRCISRSCSAAARAGKTPLSAQGCGAFYLLDVARSSSSARRSSRAAREREFPFSIYRLFNRVSRAFS